MFYPLLLKLIKQYEKWLKTNLIFVNTFEINKVTGVNKLQKIYTVYYWVLPFIKLKTEFNSTVISIKIVHV